MNEKKYLAATNLTKLRIAENILRNTVFMKEEQEKKLIRAIIEIDRLVRDLENEIDIE